jgi:hypothetical protein
MAANRAAAACEKFAASLRLEPTIGTQLNLAVCYEKIGRTASAWAHFAELQTTARRAGQEPRADFAKKKAEALAPRLSKLRVTVGERRPGLAITFGGAPLAESAWGSLVPVDPGEHVLAASAPGRKPWSQKISVGANADEINVAVPVLAPEPTAVPAPDGGRPAGGGSDAAKPVAALPTILGWSFIGGAAAAAAAGVALRVVALDKDEASDPHCLVGAGGTVPGAEDKCDQEGKDLRDAAQALQLGSVVAWAGGGALLVTGVVLLVTAPSSEDSPEAAMRPRWNVALGPDGVGLTLGARW